MLRKPLPSSPGGTSFPAMSKSENTTASTTASTTETHTAATRLLNRPVGALTELPEGFHGLAGARKVDALLALEDPKAFIAALDPAEALVLFTDIGLTDCTELLALTTPEQRAAFFDLDAWRGPELDTEKVDEWLDLLEAADADTVPEAVAALDSEFLTDYVLSLVKVVFERTDEDAYNYWLQSHDLVESPDGQLYLVVERGDEESARRVRRLLGELYRHDVEMGFSLLIHAQTGLRLENEELAHQFRVARLADLGFPPPEDAHVLYSRLNVAEIRDSLPERVPSIPPEAPPLGWALMRGDVRRDSFLARCLDAVEPGHDGDGRRDAVARELGLCVNRAVVASPEGLDLRDTDRLGELAVLVAGATSIGLEVLTEGSVSAGAALLGRVSVLELHQLGHTQLVELAVRARRIAARGGGLLDPDTLDLLSALDARPSPRWSAAAGEASQPFKRFAELAATTKRVAAAERQVDLFEHHLGFSRERFEAHAFTGLSPDDKRFIRFDTLLRTLAAHVGLGRAPSFDPLKASDVLALIGQLGAVMDRVAVFGGSLDGQARDALGAAARQLVEELRPLSRTDVPDARFLGGVLLVKNSTDVG